MARLSVNIPPYYSRRQHYSSSPKPLNIDRIARTDEPSHHYDPWTALLIELTRFANELPRPGRHRKSTP